MDRVSFFQALRDKGCDMDSAMERFLEDEDLYVECYTEVLKDPAFTRLKEALDANNVEMAFNQAHTLKGVFANCSMNPLYDVVVKMVEPLRAGRTEGLFPLYEKLIATRDDMPLPPTE